MRIAVVGLLPELADRVRSAFPNHDLRFVSGDRQNKIDEIVKTSDKVILMRRFIAHSTSDKVPMSKRVILGGSESTLKTWLQTAPTKVVTIKHDNANKGNANMAPAENEIDWTALKTAAIGDEVTAKRPARVTMPVWETRVHAVRSYYRTKHGIKTEVAFRDGVAHVKVIEIIDKKKKAAEPVAEVEPTAMTLHDADVLPDNASPAAKYFTAPAVESPALVFWRDVVLSRVRSLPGSSADDAIAFANAIAEAERARFGT
jgi:hypothetical protein